MQDEQKEATLLNELWKWLAVHDWGCRKSQLSTAKERKIWSATSWTVMSHRIQRSEWFNNIVLSSDYVIIIFKN